MSAQKTQWNEATRVQMPALVHLMRIGYTYYGKITEDKAGSVYDPDTNILIDVFKEQFARMNPDKAGEADAMLRTIRQELDNDDIGESFYKRLKAISPVRLVDFDRPQNNTYYDEGVTFNFESKTAGIKNLMFDSVIQNIKIPLPSDELLSEYQKRVSLFYDKIQDIFIESAKLAELRDFLLPMLMNGKLKVCEG